MPRGSELKVVEVVMTYEHMAVEAISALRQGWWGSRNGRPCQSRRCCRSFQVFVFSRAPIRCGARLARAHPRLFTREKLYRSRGMPWGSSAVSFPASIVPWRRGDVLWEDAWRSKYMHR